MSASSPSPQWQLLSASSLVDVLNQDEDIEDVVPLSGAEVPGWLQRLSIPRGWQLVELPDIPDLPLTRIAVCGQRGNGEWEAADTISVFGYTGWPVFYDVFRNADRTLRDLNATGIAVKVLPIPPIQRTAALRSSGTALIGDRSVWVEQSTYVAGSEQPHAGRLIVHNIFADNTCRGRLEADMAKMSDAVYQGFVATLDNQHHVD
jgi:hypothetical protein